MRIILAAAISLLTASTAALSANAGFQSVSYTVAIGSAELEPGSEATVELSIIDIGGDLPLGAWIIDVTYDPDVVSIVDCRPIGNNVCDQRDGRSRIEGASAKGLTEDTTVARLAIRCIDQGSSELAIWAGTAGIPEIVYDVTTLDGEVVCRTAPTPTAAPSTAPGLPETGSPQASQAPMLLVLPTALAAAGLALLAACWRLRLIR